MALQDEPGRGEPTPWAVLAAIPLQPGLAGDAPLLTTPVSFTFPTAPGAQVAVGPSLTLFATSRLPGAAPIAVAENAASAAPGAPNATPPPSIDATPLPINTTVALGNLAPPVPASTSPAPAVTEAAPVVTPLPPAITLFVSALTLLLSTPLLRRR